MKRQPPPGKEDLREWLRHGDPLSEGIPTEPEMRQLRAQVLLGAGRQVETEPSRHALAFAAIGGPWSRTVWTGGIVLALAAVFVLWLTGWTPSRNTREASIVHPTPPQEQRPARPPARQAQTADTSRPSGVRPAVQRVRPEPPRKQRVASFVRPAPAEAGADGSRTPLQVQFTTPGGTRIVWVLNPDFVLQRLQQED